MVRPYLRVEHRDDCPVKAGSFDPEHAPICNCPIAPDESTNVAGRLLKVGSALLGIFGGSLFYHSCGQ
jgi:hypothetical protein